MKYLKPFNEAVTQDTIELCCVDLFDDGFELKGKSSGAKTIVQFQKIITSNLEEENFSDNLSAIIGEHLKSYRPGTITISGKDFDKITTKERGSGLSFNSIDYTFTDIENELIDKVSNSANLLSHFSDSKGPSDCVYITINSSALQNPMNFQYERYRTIIDITFYL
jgi:hypothetical protein